MDVRIPKKIGVAYADELAEHFDIKRDWSYSDYVYLCLSNYSKDKCQRLLDIINKDLTLRGSKTLVRDIKTWMSICEDSKAIKKAKARTVSQSSQLIIERLRKTPRQHIYIVEGEGEVSVSLAYYVEEVQYHPPRERDDVPPCITMKLKYSHFGEISTYKVTLYAAETLYKTADEALASVDAFVETPVLRDNYLLDAEKFYQIRDKVGQQYLAVGVGDDDGVDGNEDGDDGRWRRHYNNRIRFDLNGEPSRVVLDVFRETDQEKDRRRDSQFSTWFWRTQRNNYRVNEDDDVDVDDEYYGDEEFDDDGNLITLTAEIPVHPYVVVFHLRKHLRLQTHVSNLEEYVYSPEVFKNLVIPQEHETLINTLLFSSNQFKDHVEGKGGGVIVLCQGLPGTGKTLTAEIYSEKLQKPLYTVQCSQLGVDAESLEHELTKALARGRRWGAVMLIDEADVYVSHRGNDLTQNAIVGVFLRVLEYQQGVLFLTTNRGDLVDDAILSRCTARIPYGIPGRRQQALIWRNLADLNDIHLPDETIEGILEVHNRMSGRDIKNVLKLAEMVSNDRKGVPIDVDLVSEVKKFKPTAEYFEKQHELIDPTV